MTRPHRTFVLALLLAIPGASAAMAAGVAPTAVSRETKLVLPFIADDYTRAVAEARARKVPLFIEAWAPW